MIKWDRTKGSPEPIRLLNRIREEESGEPLVDLREYAPTAQIHRATVIPYLRKSVAQMLEEAAIRLGHEGFRLGVVDAWRPLERQQRIYDFMMRHAIEAFPERDHAALRRTVCRWVAPTDQKAPPGHCTGAAVDVWLLGPDGEPADVSSPFDRFKAARTYVLGLTPEAHRNRTLLVETMLQVGFSNCRDEWWHYSYGDAGWAVRLGFSSCVYGLAHLNRELYRQLEVEHEAAMVDRPSPFK